MTDARAKLVSLRAAHAGRPTPPLTSPSKAPQTPVKQADEPTPAPTPAPAPQKASMEAIQQHRDHVSQAHRAYIEHHWNCKTCIAAGQRRGDRCTIGQALWQAYSDIAGR